MCLRSQTVGGGLHLLDDHRIEGLLRFGLRFVAVERPQDAQPGAADRAAKVKAFCRTFAERAFRRPLSGAETALFVDRQFEAAGADVLELGVPFSDPVGDGPAIQAASERAPSASGWNRPRMTPDSVCMQATPSITQVFMVDMPRPISRSGKMPRPCVMIMVLDAEQQELRDMKIELRIVKDVGGPDREGVVGFAYDESADKRSWRAMLDLFDGGGATRRG